MHLWRRCCHYPCFINEEKSKLREVRLSKSWFAAIRGTFCFPSWPGYKRALCSILLLCRYWQNPAPSCWVDLFPGRLHLWTCGLPECRRSTSIDTDQAPLPSPNFTLGVARQSSTSVYVICNKNCLKWDVLFKSGKQEIPFLNLSRVQGGTCYVPILKFTKIQYERSQGKGQCIFSGLCNFVSGFFFWVNVLFLLIVLLKAHMTSLIP